MVIQPFKKISKLHTWVRQLFQGWTLAERKLLQHSTNNKNTQDYVFQNLIVRLIIYLRWPADPGKYESFALLLKYSSSNVVQAPISSGRPRRLFEAREIFWIAATNYIVVNNHPIWFLLNKKYLVNFLFLEECWWFCFCRGAAPEGSWAKGIFRAANVRSCSTLHF